MIYGQARGTAQLKGGYKMFMKYIDLIIVIVFFMGLLGVSYVASRKVKNAEDFTVAGGNLNFTILLGTIIASVIGASATLGRAGKAYEVGFIIILSAFAYAVGLVLFGYLSGHIRKLNIWTIPEALGTRYGSEIRVITGFMLVLAVIALFGAQLIAMGYATIAIVGDIGISYNQAIFGTGLLIILYTILGGLLAVAYTDLIQAVIMVIAIGLILPGMLVADVSGPSAAIEMIANPPEGALSSLSPTFIISIFIIDIAICLVDPFLWQRAAAAKSSTDIKKAMWISGISFLSWGLIIVSIGSLAIHLLPDVVSADAVIPELITNYMPPVIKGLCIAALMGIMMSTADTALLVAGTTVSWDMLKIFRPETSDKVLLRTTRITILVIGLLGMIFATYVSGIFDILLLAYALFISAVFVPTICALFWKKATKAGALSSSLMASLTVILLYVLKMLGHLPQEVEPIIVSLGVSFVFMVGVSLATYNERTASLCLSDRNLKNHDF